MHQRRWPTLLLAPATAGWLAVTACGQTAATGAVSGHAIQVVAGENFWGSIAAQLGGSHVSVTSIVTDPNADPHEYASNTNDARAFANADYVVLNGAGYDDWAQKLLDANPSSSRTVRTVATVLGKRPGDNPHFWYSPAFVLRVVDQITADFERIDPSDATAFASLRSSFLRGMQPYRDTIASVAHQFAGQKVAATEDIFVYMAAALHLSLISPPEFMQAVAEGNDPPASAVAAFEQQIQGRQATLLVYNTQTVTAVTTNIEDLARRVGIKIVGISETVQPPNAPFQTWQLRELDALQTALAATRASP
ncbi:MAG: ABC transporter substrate-binding protein [Chloroflexi bacterium]|nr:MAG: ABC transporter substrate-binding protein [Chloroflexota bacterium]